MRSSKWLLVPGILVGIVLLSLLDHSGLFGYRGDDRSRFDGTLATVTRVIDGDTIEVDIPDGNRPGTRIRLLGIDCPEVAHRGGGQDSWFGPEARTFVLEHFERRAVRLVMDPRRETRDRHGRLLAYVYLPDRDEMLNLILIREGLACADTRFPHVASRRFARAEKAAIKSRVGIWTSLRTEDLPAWRRTAPDVLARDLMSSGQ